MKPLLCAILLFTRIAQLSAANPPALSPTDLPANLPVLESPRNWGDTFLPKSNPPARQILAVSLAGLKPDERIALTCLQGLLARQQPRLWLIRNQDDPFWMDWHKTRGHVDSFQTITDWPALFQQFRDAVQGVVIPDDQLFRGDLLALNAAACDNLIVASPALAQRLGLPIKLDLRGRFPTYA